MLRGLILENFKAFGGRRVIPIKPITLIFGPNSAGKSAIIQSLLLLKQAMNDEQESRIRFTGPLVDLQDFHNVVFKHELNRSIEITPMHRVLVDYPSDTTLLPMIESMWNWNQIDVGNQMGLGLRLKCSESFGSHVVEELPIYVGDTSIAAALVRDLPTPERIPIRIRGTKKYVNRTFRRVNSAVVEKNSQHQIWNQAIQFLIDLGIEPIEVVKGLDGRLQGQNVSRRGIRLTTARILEPEFPEYEGPSLGTEGPADSYGYSVDFPFPSLAELAEELSISQNHILERLIHLAPVRGVPSRYERLELTDLESIGSDGRRAFELFADDGEVLRSLNQTILNFGLNYQVRVRRLRDSRGKTEIGQLKLVDQLTKVEVGLADVGYGVGQVLPVRTVIGLSQGSVILVEQPELHLHPRLQAQLGDVLIKSALQLNGLSQNTLVIETHSEHLILRLMRRMRETANGSLPDGIPHLTPNYVSIIYVHPQPDGSGSIPIPIELDEEGNLLTAWPGGFFEEGFNERFA